MKQSAGKPVVAFFLLAYALSWAWLVPMVVAGTTVRQGSGWPTHLPSLLGPLLAAVVVTACTTGPDGLRALGNRIVRWRIGWRWWLVALSPLAVLGVQLTMAATSSVDFPSVGDFAVLSGIPAGWGVLGVASVVILVGALGEETGWRGYALPRLQRRFNPLTASLIIAGVWAGWHVPLILVLDSYRSFSIAMVPVLLIGLAAGCVVLTWIYNHTGSILACAVWHGTYNLASGSRAAEAGGGALQIAVWALVVIVATTLIVLERRADRSGGQSVLAHPRAGIPTMSEVNR